jgi:glycerol-3-phosphate dehydrogenase/1-acyl-sn-glycerol-3-phosphate acyltransferase
MSEKTEAGFSAPWQREFFKNIESFVKYGVEESRAKELLVNFLKLSSETPMPKVMESLRDESALERVGVYTQKVPFLRDFMVQFFDPLMRNFTIEGKENLSLIVPLLGKFPLVLISNHLSHFDTAAIYNLLYREGGDARKLADSLVFIAGRLAFEPDFTRLGLYMIDSLLVCSKRDMQDNPGQADLMTRINMRSFRHAQQLQKDGKVIAVFPEGTRSRTGKLIAFVDTVYHYVANKIIIPVSLQGTEEVLPTEGFLFNAAYGKLSIGKPTLVGELSKKQMPDLPDYVERLEMPEDGDKKQFVIDNLALLIGQNLHRHRHGAYRNLYQGDAVGQNTLISRAEAPVEKIAVIGHSPYGTAAAAVLANKKVAVKIWMPEQEKVEYFNERAIDADYYPLFKLPPNIEFTSNPDDIAESTIIVQAARSWELEAYYSKVKDALQRTTGPIVNIVKGFTGSKHGLILDDLEKLYGLDPSRLAVLAGANYPEQIMERKISGFEVAAHNSDMVDHLARLFSTGYVFTRRAVNPQDVRGVQLGGALKNIYALGMGLLDGYYEKNLGGNSDNSLFHLSNRVFREMKKIGVALGGVESTFDGLSGLTDLMLSCFGQDARDRQYGHDFIYGRVKPEQKSSGIIGLRYLPGLIQLDPEQYPIAWSIYQIAVAGVNIDKLMMELTYSLRRF